MAAEFADKFPAEPDAYERPPRRRGWTGCLVGCLVLCLFGMGLCAGIGVYLYRNVADLTRSAIVSGIEQSELDEAEKREIIAQVDRLVEQYKQGQITMADLQRIMEELSGSPLMGLILIASLDAKYIAPSGLSDEEKQQGRRTLQRVLRGTTEDKITIEAVEAAAEPLMEKGTDGSQQLKENVTDEELRRFLSRLKQQADEAEIPDEPFEVKISEEFRRAVDRALAPGAGSPP